jgi:predicted enzyme related to lactoylglutathione lyase
MPRITHFDLYADDPERAVAFYEKALGWKFEKWDGPMEYWLVNTGPDDEPGIHGGLSRRDDPATTTVNTISVSSLDEYTKKIEATGGTITAPKSAIPGVGWFAMARDTEGNEFGLMEDDPDAK